MPRSPAATMTRGLNHHTSSRIRGITISWTGNARPCWRAVEGDERRDNTAMDKSCKKWWVACILLDVGCRASSDVRGFYRPSVLLRGLAGPGLMHGAAMREWRPDFPRLMC